jgi:uncharacterized membrane protein YidH (DUF202 family)
MTNPIGGLVPDFNIWGAAFTTWYQKLFVGLWGLLIIGAIAALAMALAKLHRATTNNVPGTADEAKAHAVWAGTALGALVGLGVIVTAIFTVAG